MGCIEGVRSFFSYLTIFIELEKKHSTKGVKRRPVFSLLAAHLDLPMINDYGGDRSYVGIPRLKGVPHLICLNPHGLDQHESGKGAWSSTPTRRPRSTTLLTPTASASGSA